MSIQLSTRDQLKLDQLTQGLAGRDVLQLETLKSNIMDSEALHRPAHPDHQVMLQYRQAVYHRLATLDHEADPENNQRPSDNVQDIFSVAPVRFSSPEAKAEAEEKAKEQNARIEKSKADWDAAQTSINDLDIKIKGFGQAQTHRQEAELSLLYADREDAEQALKDARIE